MLVGVGGVLGRGNWLWNKGFWRVGSLSPLSPRGAVFRRDRPRNRPRGKSGRSEVAERSIGQRKAGLGELRSLRVWAAKIRPRSVEASRNCHARAVCLACRAGCADGRELGDGRSAGRGVDAVGDVRASYPPVQSIGGDLMGVRAEASGMSVVKSSSCPLAAGARRSTIRRRART